MKFGSVCSGIEAASVAWGPLGWEASWFAEIEPFPSAVLAHHYPATPNLGDMTKIARQVLNGAAEAPDVLCGGTPCQAFSVAGLRQSLGDARGGLTLKFVELADAIDHVRGRAGKPESIVFWENVPGVLSTKDNAFGCFLGALVGESDALVPTGGRWTDAGCVYGPKRAAAWRVLDAQYFGLAQRRRRVFVVASARSGFDPAAVLFERDGVRRDTAPSRGEGQDVAGHAPFGPALQCGCGYLFGQRLGPYGCPACEGEEGPAVEVLAGQPAFGSGARDSLFQAGTLTATPGRLDFDSEAFLMQPTHTLRGEGFDASEDGTGRGTPLVPVAFPHVDLMPTMTAGGPSDTSHGQTSGQMREQYIVPVAFDTTQITSAANYSNPKAGGPCHPLAAGAHPPAIAFHPTQDPISSEDGSTHCMGTGSSQGGATIAVAFQERGRTDGRSLEIGGDVAYALTAPNGGGRAQERNVMTPAMQVRRLTPMECERLQGFPDGYTAIPWRKKPASECPDGPRYKALGNSWAVPNVRWIGRRIAAQIAIREAA